MLVERGFEGDQAGGKVWVEDEVEVAAFEDALDGTEEEDFVFQDRAANVGGGIPAEQEGGAGAGVGNVVGVENRVAMENGDAAVPIVGAAAGDYVDDAAGGVAEFGFVARGNYLKFQNGVLVELAGGAAVEIVTIGKS